MLLTAVAMDSVNFVLYLLLAVMLKGLRGNDGRRPRTAIRRRAVISILVVIVNQHTSPQQGRIYIRSRRKGGSAVRQDARYSYAFLVRAENRSALVARSRVD